MNEQRFYRGHRVAITGDLPIYMGHFTGGCEAVVDGSYRDKYGGEDIKNYSLVLDLPEGPKSVSWYEVDQLTLIDSDRDKGEAFLQARRSRND